MFDIALRADGPRVRVWTGALADAEVADDPAELVEEIRSLEELANAARARQQRLTAALDAQRTDGDGGRGVAAEVALARRESPHRGRRHLSLARIAPELPHTMEAFRRGLVTEWRVTVVAKETACLSREDRLALDRAIAGDPDAFAGYSDRVVLAEVGKLAARLDPAAVTARRRRAESERGVTIRRAPRTRWST